MADQAKPLRADAQRNRDRLLEVASTTFADEGLAVPIDEIARRAGVGAGTVYRHFPTKEALIYAIVVDVMEDVVAKARELGETEEPAAAFFAFFTHMVEVGARHHGLVDALAGSEFDPAHSAPEAERRFMEVLGELLTGAQQAGAVRPDVDVAEVKTLLVGYQAMQRHVGAVALSDALIDVVQAGLAPDSARRVGT